MPKLCETQPLPQKVQKQKVSLVQHDDEADKAICFAGVLTKRVKTEIKPNECFATLKIHGATQSWHRISIQYYTSRKTGTTETKRKHPPGWSSQCLTVPLAGIVFSKCPLESNQLRNKPSIQWPSCSWNRRQWHTNMGNNKRRTQWMS